MFSRHQKFEVLQAGRQLAFNLIETIQQEYMQTHPQHPPPVINNLVLPQGNTFYPFKQFSNLILNLHLTVDYIFMVITV